MKPSSLFHHALACSILAGIASAQFTLRSSISPTGAQGNSPSQAPAISDDGRFVAFYGGSTTFFPGDTNLGDDVFVRDQVTGRITLVSRDANGNVGNGDSREPAITNDCRFVAFYSFATNLVPGDTNDFADVFVFDMFTLRMALASQSTGGAQADGPSDSRPALSADGQFIAYASRATNLVSNDANGVSDIFVRDVSNGFTTRISESSSGLEGNGTFGSTEPSISADGRYVAFTSDCTNLVANDTNACADVFVHDRFADLTTRISKSSSGVQADNASETPAISADGRYVAFTSRATNLVPGDTNAPFTDVFVHDLLTGQTTRVSVDSLGKQGFDNSLRPSISGEGRYVAFESDVVRLVAGDTNGARDVFVHDRHTAETTRASVDSTAGQANNSSRRSRIAASGRYVAFESEATNLVGDDTNAHADVFMRDRLGFEPYATFCAVDDATIDACPCSAPDTVPSPGGAPGHGCANSLSAAGGLLSATGLTNPDTIVFSSHVAPGYLGFAFLVKGNSHNGAGIPLGDGLRCVDGALLRFGGHPSGSHGDSPGYWSYPNAVHTSAVSAVTFQPPGETAWYQLFYRNASAGFCSPGTTNLTNGVRLSWP